NKIAHDECAPTIRSVMANIHSAIHEAASNSKGYMKNIHAEIDIQHKLKVPFKYMRAPRIRSCVWELPWYEEVKINCYGCSPSNPGMAGSRAVFKTYTGEPRLEFKPSEVATAVSISVIRETNLNKYEPYFIKNVQKERVFKCFELIHELQRSATV
ncbi:hypothetical protein GIB67_039406, partial [Kingdonia uniflora]